MPVPGDTLYSLDLPATPVYGLGVSQTATLAVWEGDAQATVASGTYTLRRQGETPLVDAEAVTVAASGAATYTLDLSATAETALGEGYREVWALVMPDGTTRQIRRGAVVGRYPLLPPATYQDLISGRYPALAAQFRDSSTTVQDLADEAWAEILRLLERRGAWADLVYDPTDVRDLYEHTALERILGALYSTSGGDRFRVLQQDHRERADALRASLVVQVDRDRDGYRDGPGRESLAHVVHPSAPPRSRRRPGERRW